LTILGKWSPYPPAGGACPGYLVEADGVRILLDCGSGVVSSLHRVGTAFDLNAIVIYHLHPDHFTDIYPLRNELAYGRLPGPPASGVQCRHRTVRGAGAPRRRVRPVPLRIHAAGRR